MIFRGGDGIIVGIILHAFIVLLYSSSEFVEKYLNQLPYVACLVLVFITIKFISDILEIMYPPLYINLHTKKIGRENRPLLDAFVHAILFRLIRVILGDGYIYQILLIKLNNSYLTWDETFESRGEDAKKKGYTIL